MEKALSKGTGFWVLVPALLSKASKTDCLCRMVGPGGDWPMSCHQPEQLPVIFHAENLLLVPRPGDL